MAGAAVTMLFSDIEGSTLVLRRLGERFSELIAEHHRVMRLAIEAGGGRGTRSSRSLGELLTRLIVRNGRSGT